MCRVLGPIVLHVFLSGCEFFQVLPGMAYLENRQVFAFHVEPDALQQFNDLIPFVRLKTIVIGPRNVDGKLLLRFLRVGQSGDSVNVSDFDCPF